MIVVDAEGGRLLRATAAGVTALATGLAEPVALLLESGGSALVSEAGAGRISRVNLRNGSRQTLVEGLQRPTGVARMRDGRLVIVEPEEVA